MALLIDTQALAWIALDSPRLSTAARNAMLSDPGSLLISAVTAYEFADLNSRRRFGADLPLEPLIKRLVGEVLDFPAQCWTLAVSLPPIHRDPIDRMLIAHAIAADLTLVTADATMRAYPVRSLW